MDKIYEMYNAENVEPKILEKLIRFAKRDKGNVPHKPDDGYKIKKKYTPNDIDIRPIDHNKRPLEPNIPDKQHKKVKVDIPVNRQPKTSVNDKDVDEAVINGLASDFIELTVSTEQRPPKFSMSIIDIKEIIRRLCK